MAINNIIQPEIIPINDTLRLRKYTDDCDFALAWYQDEETLMLVDGAAVPYDMDRLYRMYHYLADRGEVYFIEARENTESAFEPIGDVTFWQEDMPIVIGKREWRQRGIGSQVVRALICRAGALGFDHLCVSEIYEFNTDSRKLFERMGFMKHERTERGFSYRLVLQEE